MRNETLDQELSAFDFSLCHPVRTHLLNKLLTIHRADNVATEQPGRKWTFARLDDKELDRVVAAGSGGNLQNSEEWMERVTNHVVEGK